MVIQPAIAQSFMFLSSSILNDSASACNCEGRSENTHPRDRGGIEVGKCEAMMRSIGAPLCVCCLVLAIAGGCDDRPTPPKTAAQGTQESDQPDAPGVLRPTTQELLAGPYKRLALA